MMMILFLLLRMTILHNKNNNTINSSNTLSLFYCGKHHQEIDAKYLNYYHVDKNGNDNDNNNGNGKDDNIMKNEDHNKYNDPDVIPTPQRVIIVMTPMTIKMKVVVLIILRNTMIIRTRMHTMRKRRTTRKKRRY